MSEAATDTSCFGETSMKSMRSLAREQSHGIGQVGEAVGELDRVTQQNAVLVEQTAHAAADMRELARTLAEEVARFRIPADGG